MLRGPVTKKQQIVNSVRNPSQWQEERLVLNYVNVPVQYRNVPKFLDARKLNCNLPKIEEKRPNLWIFC